MDAPEEEDERQFFTRRLIEGLRYTFTKFTIALDEGERDDDYRRFEKFEIFFMIPDSCQALDCKDIDSILVFEMLVYQGVRAVENRYRQLLPSLPEPARGLGIHKEILWRFGDEVREAEGMLGDPEEPGDLPACLTFWARFALPLSQHASRCKTAPIHVPRELPERTNTQFVVTEEGLVREVVLEDEAPDQTPMHWKKLPGPRDPNKPRFFPADDRYGYEDEEEEWEED